MCPEHNKKVYTLDATHSRSRRYTNDTFWNKAPNLVFCIAPGAMTPTSEAVVPYIASNWAGESLNRDPYQFVVGVFGRDIKLCCIAICSFFICFASYVHASALRVSRSGITFTKARRAVTGTGTSDARSGESDNYLNVLIDCHQLFGL